MKLILTQEVTGLGAPGDVVEVKDGYGRNYLIPRGFGIRWTRGGEKTIDSIKKAREARSVRDSDHAAQAASSRQQAAGKRQRRRWKWAASRLSAKSSLRAPLVVGGRRRLGR